MPPHCDSLDGPVVQAARSALEKGRLELVLPYVPESSEQEVERAFASATAARVHGADARDVADRWFFETVVRVHRAGEGAPYTGLKPAGLGHGPVVPVVERAIAAGHCEELLALLTEVVQAQVQARFDQLLRLKGGANGDVGANRRYVDAMLGLEVWSHKLYEAAMAHPHEHQENGP